MLTPEIVKEAIKTSHDACEVNGCVHAKSIAPHFAAILALLADSPDLVSAFVTSFHIGFRAGELASTAPAATSKETVN